MKYFIPLLIFLCLTVFLLIGLKLDPRLVPSPYINKPAPSFSLSRLDNQSIAVQRDDFLGKTWVLNVWASWCRACLDEHPLLLSLPKNINLVGLNYKDDKTDAKNWLLRWGNPYSLSLSDTDGKVGFDWGVYGVPETFVIDAAGVVRYKHIGPLQENDINEELLPLLKRLSTPQ